MQNKINYIAGLVVIIAWTWFVPEASAQFFGGKGADPTEQLSKIFGSATAFSATAVMTMRDKNGKITATTETEMAMLDGKVRSEMDLTKVRGSDAPEQSNEEKQLLAGLGINRTVSIVRPDQKLVYMVFPNLNAYCAEPLQGGSPTDAASAKIEKKELGKETVDGHPCVKSLVTITTKNEKIEATVWEAMDLKNFPVKSQYSSKEGSVVATFKNLKLDKPAAALFEPPAGATKYKNAQELMQAEMLKNLKF